MCRCPWSFVDREESAASWALNTANAWSPISSPSLESSWFACRPPPPTHTSVSPAPGAHGICIVCDVGLRLCHPRQPTLPTRIAYSDSIPAARIASTVQYAPLTAGRVLNSSQCQGALEECHPQRQPHHLLRARASLQRQGCTLLPALSSSQPAGSIEQYAPVMRMAGAAYPLQHLQCQLGANRMLFWVGTDAAVADWQAAGSGRAGWR